MQLKRATFLALIGTLAVPVLASPSTLTGALAALVEDEVKPLEVGSTVPDTIRLMDFEGKPTSFKDLRGKIVLLHFWSDRCPAEKHGDPVFLALEKKYAGSKDVVLLGIASNQNELGPKPAEGDDYAKFYGDLRKKRDEVGYKHTILADHGNVVSDLFGAKSTPHCFVIDAKGVLQYGGALDDDLPGKKGDQATNYLANAADALLAGKTPEVQATKPYG
jgi:thiol-disulfide isomerase/thioredoxin